jgi:glycyl-tRNA synthetase
MGRQPARFKAAASRSTPKLATHALPKRGYWMTNGGITYVDGVMDKLASLCKRRGFIFQSSEIYGGFGGFWDYGPLGCELMQNVRDFWWNWMVRSRRDVAGLDSSIISNPEVWVASGHVGHFFDIMLDDLDTKERFRADHFCYGDEEDQRRAFKYINDWLNLVLLLDPLRPYFKKIKHTIPNEILSLIPNFKDSLERFIRTYNFQGVRYEIEPDAEIPLAQLGGLIAQHFWETYDREGIGKPVINPRSGKRAKWSEPKQFNLMLKTQVGAATAAEIEKGQSIAYLRAETCQPIFVDFEQIRVSARMKPPFGVAQVGKAFRNEINPRNFTFRSREFTQMEMEFFIPPDSVATGEKRLPEDRTEMEWFEYWKEERRRYYETLGLWDGVRMRLRDHVAGELAHYAKAACDFEFAFPFGWAEMEGVHHRGDFDLTQHEKHSGKKMEYFDADRGNARYMPVVIETSVGLDRTVLALLCAAYDEDLQETKKEGKDEDVRVVMRLPKQVAPIKVAVLPLSKKLNDYADKLEQDLSKHLVTEFDVTGSIGKRYRRQDEIGTPYCVTVDFETIEGARDGADTAGAAVRVEGAGESGECDGDLKDTVTIRDRDSLDQVRVHVDRLAEWLRERLH